MALYCKGVSNIFRNNLKYKFKFTVKWNSDILQQGHTYHKCKLFLKNVIQRNLKIS